MGSIIGQYEQTEQFSCPYTQELRRPTGAVTTRKYLDLFTWHLPLGSTDSPYADSIRTSGYHWFSLFGRELPLGIYQESFHEYRTRLLTLTPAEAAQNVEEQIQRCTDGDSGEINNRPRNRGRRYIYGNLYAARRDRCAAGIILTLRQYRTIFVRYCLK